MNHFYTVTGMHCGGCASKISTALQKIRGVITATVTLNPPEAHIQTERDIPIDVLNDALAPIGAYRLNETQPQHSQETGMPDAAELPESLYPLFLIVGYIAGTVGLISLASGDYSMPFLMNNFMAGFFLVFSFFKLLDLRGFSDAYRSYDLLAHALPGWSFAYPFVELALGISYLSRISPVVTNAVTFALMLIGAAGVLRALLDKRTIRCACLGTALKLPMTKVTLVEDLGMATMALVMLILYAQ